MNLKKYLWICFSSISSILCGQHIQIQGQVVNQAIPNQPIAFANISIYGKSYGVASNEEGKFRLSIPISMKKDTLCVSYIGYKMVKLPISEIDRTKPVWVQLIPNIQSLQEIAIIDSKIPSADKLMKKAIKRITKNYANNTYLMEGYYRDFLDHPEGYENLLEAAIGIYDGGFLTDDLQSRVKVYQSRYSKGFSLNYGEYYENNIGGTSGNISIVGGNELSVVMYNNPVRNFKRQLDIKTGYELDDNFIKNHDLSVEYITYVNEERVYCLQAKGNKFHPYLQRNQGKGVPEGMVYIRAKDQAILKIEYSLKVGEGKEQKKMNELKMEYREYQNKMYLNYISFANYIQIKGDYESKEYKHTRELFINNIRTNQLPSPDAFYLFSEIQNMYNQSYLSDPGFWNEYNMVLKKDN